MENNWEEELDKLPSDEGGEAIERMHPTDREKLKAFISTLLQEQRQRMAKEIEGKKQECICVDICECQAYGFNSGLQAALNIVLGEGEKIINELNKNEH